jgi:hypothetical protein
MEFFQEICRSDLDVNYLKSILTIRKLPELCDSINTVIKDNGSEGEIYTVWGQFTVKRDPIVNGMRFTLNTCPHAFAWTITWHEERNKVVVHCTIDKTEHDPDFIDSIEQFAKDWAAGLKNSLG